MLSHDSVSTAMMIIYSRHIRVETGDFELVDLLFTPLRTLWYTHHALHNITRVGLYSIFFSRRTYNAGYSFDILVNYNVLFSPLSLCHCIIVRFANMPCVHAILPCGPNRIEYWTNSYEDIRYLFLVYF